MAKITNNWKLRGIQWSQTRVGEEFKWGKTDCGTLVRRLCGVIYLEDIFPDVPEYGSMKEAKRVWDDVGKTNDILQSKGAMEVGPNYFRALDIAIMEDEFDFLAAGIYVRSGLLVSSVTYGVDILKRRHWPDKMYGLRLPYEVEVN